MYTYIVQLKKKLCVVKHRKTDTAGCKNILLLSTFFKCDKMISEIN